MENTKTKKKSKAGKIILIILGSILGLFLILTLIIVMLMKGYTVDSKYFNIQMTKVDNESITYKFTPKDDKSYDLYVYGDESYHEQKVVYSSSNSYLTNNENSYSIRYDPNIILKQTADRNHTKKNITKNNPVEFTLYKTTFKEKENYLHLKLFFNEWISNGSNSKYEDPNSYHDGSVQPNRLAF